MDREDTDLGDLGAAKVPLVSAEPQPRVRRTPRTRPPSRLPRPDARSIDERMAAGQALRKRCPRGTHARWRPFRGREPLAQLRQSDATRLPWLVPVRHERMAESALSAVKLGISRGELHRRMKQLTAGYLASLDGAVRDLCLRYERLEWGFKVVGVGSVGTQAYVVLCEGNGAEDPLVLQVKEAQASVLEPYLGPSGARTAGERVVVGQRRMQAFSDLFLGWTEVEGMGAFYVRQLRDMKGSLDVEKMTAGAFLDYADACGATLARAHARTGDAATLAGYLGGGCCFDEAVSDFAVTYADQVDEDYARFLEAHAREAERGPVH